MYKRHRSQNASLLPTRWMAPLLCCLLAPALEVEAAEEADAEPLVLRTSSPYTLLNPTPQASMRELSTDRPDRTESTATVPAGHFQLEMDFVNSTSAADGSLSHSIVPFNLKAGLTHNMDLQILLNTFQLSRTEGTGAAWESGVGDITTRFKINLWGNDGGKTALGVMPFLTFPTGAIGVSDGVLSGGVIVPFSISLPAGWGLSAMSELDITPSKEASAPVFSLLNTVVVGHDIVGTLGGYLELTQAVDILEDAVPTVGLDAGLTLGVSTGLQLDCGINLGLAEQEVELNPFIGMALRM